MSKIRVGINGFGRVGRCLLKTLLKSDRFQVVGLDDMADLGDLEADIVFECTGAFRPREQAAGHLLAGARRVIISAASDDADATLVPGVNADTYDVACH